MPSHPGGGLTPVLLYHDVVAGRPASPWQVSRDSLATDLDAVLESGRTVLTASALDAALTAGGDRVGRLCAVTFDDGYASFADLVLPLLVERDLAATLYVTTGFLGEPGMLSKAALDDLAGSPVEIGAHAVLHRHLDLLPVDAARTEIRDSGDRLGRLLGHAPRSFAYPHGSFNRKVRDLTAQAGYDSAYAVKNALTHPADDRYARARLTVLADTRRATVREWLDGRGAPPSWRRERLRTKAYRHVRAVRARLP
jgi:peptidoglycan/xylan/chitin deacetylase (PgdA/CDA1 family)